MASDLEPPLRESGNDPGERYSSGRPEMAAIPGQVHMEISPKHL
jgi:hypothetical protein